MGLPANSTHGEFARSRILWTVTMGVLLFIASENASGQQKPPDWQPSMQAGSWNFRFSPGMPKHPTQRGQGWEFIFPRYEGPQPCRDPLAPDCPNVEYLLTQASGLALGQSITMSVEISGSPEFRFDLEADNSCDTPASVRLLIQRRDDDFSKEFYRWWSNPQAIFLAEGHYSVNVPLIPDQWSSVFGKKGDVAPAEFGRALMDAERIGMTFGGGCFFGHGINVAGSDAVFMLNEFAIVR